MVDQLLKQEQELSATKDQDGELTTIEKESEEGSSLSPSKVRNMSYNK